jgi:NitT/TauT family transport system permease protein
MTNGTQTARFRRGAVASVALLVVFLAAWQWGPGLLGIPSFIVPPLSSVAAEFVRAWQVYHLPLHTGVTVAEVLAGFILGSLLGALVGYLLGMSPTAELALSPYILALQIAPKVAFAPLFILWMGFTVYPKILVAILIVFFPVMVNVLTAVRNVDPDLINLARAFKASRAQIFWRIEFPSSMPPMFAGLRIGSTLAVVGVVVGELVGGNLGLGYLLTFGEGQANTPMVFVSIVMLTLVGGIAYVAVIVVERRVLHYLPARVGKCSACQSASRFGLILPSTTNTPGAPSATQALSGSRSASVRAVIPRAPKPRAIAAKSFGGNCTISTE